MNPRSDCGTYVQFLFEGVNLARLDDLKVMLKRSAAYEYRKTLWSKCILMQEVDACSNISFAVWVNNQTWTDYCAVQYSEFQKNTQKTELQGIVLNFFSVHVYTFKIHDKPIWVALNWDRTYTSGTYIDYQTVCQFMDTPPKCDGLHVQSSIVIQRGWKGNFEFNYPIPVEK